MPEPRLYPGLIWTCHSVVIVILALWHEDSSRTRRALVMRLDESDPPLIERDSVKFLEGALKGEISDRTSIILYDPEGDWSRWRPPELPTE